MASPEAREEFRKKLEAEILRRMKEERNFHMTREEAEAIGQDAGMEPGEATEEFFGLYGWVWEGDVSRSDESPHAWDIAHFRVSWFQERGKLPTPLED